jgi:hypothetical protein
LAGERSEGTSVYVTSVHVEDRTGHNINDYVIDFPTVAQVLNAIRLLNGNNVTLVSLQMDGKNFGIGGGTDGRFTGELSYGIDKALYSLLSSREPSEQQGKDLELVVGQQAVLVPRTSVLNLTTILKAGRHFAEHGEMCPDLIWEKHD